MDVDHIHLLEDVAFDPDGWPRALEEIGHAHGARIMSLMRETPEGVDLLAPPDAEDARSTYIREQWLGLDVRSQRGMRYPKQLSFMTDGLLMTTDERSEGDFYRDFATRFDVPHFVGWRFAYNDERYCWTFMRSAAKGEATEAEKAQLRPLVARASAAALLAARAAKIRAFGIIDGLAASNTAALVLGIDGVVLAATPQAEQLFCIDFDVRHGRLAIGDANAAPALRMLKNALALRAVGAELRGFAFDTAMGRVVAMPMRAGAQVIEFFAGIRAILVLKPLARRVSVEPAIVQAAFGLTVAEAEIAAHLAAGLAPEEIATRRGVKVDTIRQMLKSILQKTGARRQAELAAMLAALSR